MTKKLDPDRPNKARRGRPPKGSKKVSKNSQWLKDAWASPWRRAYMLEWNKINRAKQNADRIANPEKYSRAGIPDGHTRATAAPLWAEARRKADRFMQKMADEGIINPKEVVVPDSDEAKGNAALHEACVIALGPTEKQAKLAAIRTVLEYTKSKPESRSKVTVSTSEQFLAEIAALDDAD
jgi:hypothetical protein